MRQAQVIFYYRHRRSNAANPSSPTPIISGESPSIPSSSRLLLPTVTLLLIQVRFRRRNHHSGVCLTTGSKTASPESFPAVLLLFPAVSWLLLLTSVAISGHCPSSPDDCCANLLVAAENHSRRQLLFRGCSVHRRPPPVVLFSSGKHPPFSFFLGC